MLVYFLASRLQRVISDPILHLAQVMKAVSTDKSYALRAEKQGEDELETVRHEDPDAKKRPRKAAPHDTAAKRSHRQR